MPTIQQGMVCKTCGRQTLHSRKQPNQLGHALASVLICSWIPIWIALNAMAHGEPWTCQTCGAEIKQKARTGIAVLAFIALPVCIYIQIMIVIEISKKAL